MANKIRQVQKEKLSDLPDAVTDIRRQFDILRRSLGERGLGRRYPGEWQGHILAARLNSSSPSKQTALLASIRVLQQVAQAQKDHDISAIDRLRKKKGKGFNYAYDYLVKAAKGGKAKTWVEGVHEEGLILGPSTEAGYAALAALVLEKKDRIDRIKQCLHCRNWFYARFRHQQFCSDRRKKCQWNHYHTPEWRKLHRERNRKHQREYRKRLFGRNKGKAS
jgi:hypothetical protein